MPEPLIVFEVLWYHGNSPSHAPNIVIGRDFVRKHDLSDAITWACNRLRKPRGNDSAAMAHGFYVRSLRTAGETSNFIYNERNSKS